MIDRERLATLEERLGYRFLDPSLLVRALTHASCRTVLIESNERLEFLGDAVLSLAVSRHLFDNFPDFQEGRMTQARSQIVSRQNLAFLARELELEQFLIVGRMFPSADAISSSILSDAIEAIIASIYLDGGFDAASAFVLRHFNESIAHSVEEPGGRDYKSQLVQWTQKERQESPVFRVVSMAGPDHQRTFEIEVCVGRRRFPKAYGRSKKEAAQRAARLALRELELL